MATRSTPRTDETGELALLWARFMVLFMERRDSMFAMLEQHGLTPPHGHALSMLGPEPIRMRDIADHMACDASYVTAIVDRLESVGLARREASPDDRRVKVVALTDRGLRAANDIRASMMAAPTSFGGLSTADRKALARILAKIVPELDPESDPFRPTPRR